MTFARLAALAAALTLPISLPAAAAAQTPAPTVVEAGLPAFPGAQGWAAKTVGGRGGRIIRVTNLNGEGPGSLRAAIEAEGPRIVVFEVGGVIDLDRKTLKLVNPYITIAGQTAPSPGVTLIRGGMDIGGHDVIVQHIRIRPGSAGQEWMSGWDEDGIATQAAYNVIIDHCSLEWATDENLSASGPRFTGATPEEWRAGTSHDITFSINLIAEVAEGRGEIIDHEREVGGYPAIAEPTRKPFNPDDWDLRFMTPLRDEVLDRPAQRRGT